MQSDDAIRSNQPPLCNVTRSAQLPGIPPFSYASHISPKTQAEVQEMNCRYKKTTRIHYQTTFGHVDTMVLKFL